MFFAFFAMLIIHCKALCYISSNDILLINELMGFDILGHWGFSIIGLIYLLMLLIPNIIWSKNKPEDYDSSNENKILLWFERIGQVVVTCCALMFSDTNLKAFSAWSIWLMISFVCMLIYEICWIRYFKGGHTVNDFYRSFCGIPVPLASLPVTAFLLLGIYGKVLWLILSAIIIGIGHIGIHLEHIKKIK